MSNRIFLVDGFRVADVIDVTVIFRAPNDDGGWTEVARHTSSDDWEKLDGIDELFDADEWLGVESVAHVRRRREITPADALDRHPGCVFTQADLIDPGVVFEVWTDRFRVLDGAGGTIAEMNRDADVVYDALEAMEQRDPSHTVCPVCDRPDCWIGAVERRLVHNFGNYDAPVRPFPVINILDP